jgi:hypothetical protein
LANPAVRAKMSVTAKCALANRWAHDKRRLPTMTDMERRLYNKLRLIVGRDAALAEVFAAGKKDKQA